MTDEIITLRGQRCVVIQCGICGVIYVVPEIVNQHHREHGGYSHCSNGHRWGWRTGEEQLRLDEIRMERDRLKQDAARLEEEIAAANTRAAAAEKRILQARRRAAAGVCPCCNRTFANVQRHMRTKHSNVVPMAQKAADA